nr:10257_t:CDS:10 [Entrophospora candida]
MAKKLTSSFTIFIFAISLLGVSCNPIALPIAFSRIISPDSGPFEAKRSFLNGGGGWKPVILMNGENENTATNQASDINSLDVQALQTAEYANTFDNEGLTTFLYNKRSFLKGDYWKPVILMDDANEKTSSNQAYNTNSLDVQALQAAEYANTYDNEAAKNFLYNKRSFLKGDYWKPVILMNGANEKTSSNQAYNTNSLDVQALQAAEYANTYDNEAAKNFLYNKRSFLKGDDWKPVIFMNGMSETTAANQAANVNTLDIQALQAAEFANTYNNDYANTFLELTLDSSGMFDDYYLNLLGWSNKNMVEIGLDKSVHLWNARTEEVKTLAFTRSGISTISSLFWSEDGDYFVVGLNGDIQIWDISSAQNIRSMSGHTTCKKEKRTTDFSEFIESEKGQPQSVDDTIVKLVDRANNSTLLEDRRAAILGLKGLSREYRKEVGEKSLYALLKILNEDRADIDTSKAILEILKILYISVRFIDEIIKDSSNIMLFLEILQEYDFYVRFNNVQLLRTLLAIRSDNLQDYILGAPMGISRLMDLLDDKREIIRNEGLLLLTSLTENNAEIQKIVAFENAFERLIEIIVEEDGLNGGIIVQDCMQLIINLLRYNVSNQYHNSSKPTEIDYLIQDWNEQKIINTIVLLELMRMLVVPNNMNTLTNQKVMIQCGVFKPVIELSLSSNAPSAVKTHSLYTLADLVHGNQISQELLSKSVIITKIPALPSLSTSSLSTLSSSTITTQNTATGNSNSFDHQSYSYGDDGSRSSFNDSLPNLPPRPAVLALISVAVGAEYVESYQTRAAATYAFEAYTYNNISAQLVLASTLTPPPDDNPNSEIISVKPQSAGSLLLSALLEWEDSEADPYVVWFASVILSHILKDNERAKEIARKLIVEDNQDVNNDVGNGNGTVFNSGMVDGNVSDNTNGNNYNSGNGNNGVINNDGYGDGGSNEKHVTLLNSVAKNLMMATRQNADVRVLIGYLCLLCVWLWDSPQCVKQFLSDSAHLQTLITPITQSSSVDARVQGLCAFLLGICYHFNHISDSLVSRSTLQPILHNRIGVDQFINRITRLRESPHFKHASQYLQVFLEEESIQRSVKSDPNAPQYSSNNKDLQNDLDSASMFSSLKEVIKAQEQEITQLKNLIKQFEEKLEIQTKSNEEVSLLKTQIDLLKSEKEKEKEKHQKLSKEQDDLLVCLADQDATIKKYKTRLISLGEQLTTKWFFNYHHYKSFKKRYYSSKKSSSEPVTLSFSKYDPLSNKSINLIPPLLILHGLFGSKQNWKSLAKMFAQSLNTSVYALDLRNHGDSPHSSIVNYKIMSDDVAKFIIDHKLNQAIIMGHSMGGKVAMAMALRQVPQVERLIVVDASPTNVRISDEFAFYIDTMKKVENVGVIKQSKADEIMQDYISNPSIRNFLLTNLKKDPDTGLYKFRIPLDILDDSLIYPTIETFFPNSIIAEVDAGHWVHAEKPLEFANIVTDFLKS